MASNSVVTQDKLQEFYNTKVYPYLNGSAHDSMRNVGELVMGWFSTAPAHCLLCDGSTYNKADYPQLATLLLSLPNHSQYEVSNDSTKFKVPSMGGEFIRGTGSNSYTNQGNGANVGVHQDATQIPYTFISSDNRAYTRLGSRDTSVPINPDKTISGTQYEYSVGGSKTSVNYTPMDYTSRPTNTSVYMAIVYENHYIDAMHNYSTTEHVVGTWIDGKTLYEKTIAISTPSTSTDGTDTFTDIALGASISTAFMYFGYFLIDNASMPINMYYRTAGGTSGKELLSIRVQIRTNSATISPNVLRVYNNRISYGNCSGYITIQYTKTTDTV